MRKPARFSARAAEGNTGRVEADAYVIPGKDRTRAAVVYLTRGRSCTLKHMSARDLERLSRWTARAAKWMRAGK